MKTRRGESGSHSERTVPSKSSFLLQQLWPVSASPRSLRAALSLRRAAAAALITGTTPSSIICHYDRNQQGPNAGPHTITVNANALDHHLLNHVKDEGFVGDDHVAACPEATPVSTFEATATATATPCRRWSRRPRQSRHWSRPRRRSRRWSRRPRRSRRWSRLRPLSPHLSPRLNRQPQRRSCLTNHPTGELSEGQPLGCPLRCLGTAS